MSNEHFYDVFADAYAYFLSQSDDRAVLDLADKAGIDAVVEAAKAVFSSEAVEKDAARWQMHELLMIRNGHSIETIRELRNAVDAAISSRSEENK